MKLVPDVSEPAMPPGGLLIEIHAAGLNPIDWKVRAGYMKDFMPVNFPAVLGGDFSGVVKEADAASGFNPGDQVYGQASIFAGGSGSLAEIASATPQTVARKPNILNHEEAAALPLAGTSAIQALFDHMGLAAGQKILIHGAAGGIGNFAVQIAKHIGAYVAATAGADDIEFVKSSGAEEVIDYKTQSFETMLKDYDAVFDTVGGETAKRSYQVLRPGGILVSMVENQPDPELVSKYKVKFMAQQTGVSAAHLAKLTELVEQGAVKVHVDRTFPLEEASEALTYLQTGHPRGKVVIEVRPG